MSLKNIFALIGLSLICFTGFLDATIVSSALPAMQSDLHITRSQIRWGSLGFYLPLSIFMMSAGRITDVFGRRKIFCWAAILFLLASLGAALSSLCNIVVMKNRTFKNQPK